MTILNLFVDFINKILSIKILGMDLFNWLLLFTIIIFVFRILYAMSGTKRKSKEETKEKKKKE